MKQEHGFEMWLREQERADATIATYLADVTRFVGWHKGTYGHEANPVEFTRLDVRDYRSFLETLTPKLRPATINRRLQALSTWGAWMVEVGRRLDNPAEGARRVKQERNLAPKSPSPREVAALERELERAVLNARTHTASLLAVRDRAAVELLAHTGLRVGELCALALDDVELSERRGLVHVRHGKGDKARDVPLNVEARRPLALWLELRPDSGERLFCDEGGVGLSERAVQKLLARYCRRAGVSITPHGLRHFLATSLLAQGVDVVKIAAILGHSNLATTQIYLRPSMADLGKALAKLES